MSTPLRHSIRTKLVAVSLLVEVTMLGLLLANSMRLLNETLEELTQAKIGVVTPLLNASIGARLFERDHAAIQEILRQLVDAHHTDFAYIVVYDHTKKVYAKVGQVDPERMPALDSDVAGSLSDLIYDTSSPIRLGAEILGEVRYGLSLVSLVASKREILRQGFAIALVEVALSFVLLGVAGFLLTRHLQKLTIATRRVAEGDYSIRMSNDTNDEISELATHFNSMTDAIHSRIDALRQSELALTELNRNLEIRVSERTQQLSVANDQLQHLALHDALTGLPNRRLFNELLNNTLRAAKRSQNRFAVVCIDLDDFKLVNDTLGHQAGDKLLLHVAQVCTNTLRESDTVARMGGDEFMLILPQITDLDSAIATSKRVMDAIGTPCLCGDRSVSIQSSLGVAIYPDHGTTENELISHSDAAMYKAKHLHLGIAPYQTERG